MGVRVLNCNGSGTISGVIAGVNWVTSDHDPGESAVANMSLGGGASSALDTAVRNSIADGVSYAAAAGNGNNGGVAQDACKSSPARVTEAMTIGATDKTDKKASWSNYGNCVDWFAPGVGITSAWYTSNTATNTISGTSMATPHTAECRGALPASQPWSDAAAGPRRALREHDERNRHLVQDGEQPPALYELLGASGLHRGRRARRPRLVGATAFRALR